MHRHLERVHVDLVDRRLVFLTGLAAHQERSGRNANELHLFRDHVVLRRRPYFRTSRSVKRGATAFRIVRPRAVA